MMANEGYMLSNGATQTSYRMPSSHSAAMSPMSQSRNPFEADLGLSSLAISSDRVGVDVVTGILIRKLARHTTSDSLRTLLLFSNDFINAEFVSPDLNQEQGYLAAIARFRTAAGAEEAKSRLHGKRDNPNEPPLNVEIIRLSPGGGLGPWRNTVDTTSNRANSSSSTGSSTGPVRQASRFNGQFQAMDSRISPSSGASGFSNGGSYPPAEDVSSPLSSFYPPQSPNGQTIGDRPRVSGKAMIGEDGIDDEPGDLLKDPVAYAKSDMSGQLSRHPTNPQLPASRFAGLSLSTSSSTATSPPMSGFTSPRNVAPMQSPSAVMSPTSMSNLGPNVSYQLANQHLNRHNYPPVNPADQNPPCNTLYVGNLPIDTSEDELKAMFSKQRGYKRLCFRTKQNGPMCFVEFEDVSFATKALNELYGHPLHNSVKGGIRLSFSKNPLGVRTGQPGGIGPQTPLSPSGPMLGMNGLGIQPFATANGPPPGLAVPPGLSSPTPTSMNGMISPTSPNGNFGVGDMMGMPGMRSPQGSMPWGNQGGQFSDYMFGR